MDISGPHPMKMMTFEELKRRGVLSENSQTEKEMKKSWQKYC